MSHLIRSSYIENNYGELIKQYVIAWQPSSFVELGVLDGYSTFHIAQGIKELQSLRGFYGKLDAYDLFEDYQFKHGKKEEVQKLLNDNNVSNYVNLQQGDAYQVYKNYPDMVLDAVRGIEFLHVDISNTGDVIKEIIDLWHPKIGQRGLMLIEGGTRERDEVEWMLKYGKKPIKPEIDSNKLINKYYMYGTYMAYPGLTVLLRKWWDVK